MDILIVVIALLLFALRVGSEAALIILALCAVRAVNHFIPRQGPSRLSLAFKAASNELFKKR